MKVKVCPDCGHTNKAEGIYCVKDYCDIESVAPTDEGEAAPATGMPPPKPAPEKRSEEPPAHPMGGTETRRVGLVAHLVTPDSQRILIGPNVVVGRRPVADVDLTDVPNGDTISRSHARFTCDDGLWRIEILTDANASFIDNNRVHQGERVPLRNGARVTLAEATFVFQSP